MATRLKNNEAKLCPRSFAVFFSHTEKLKLLIQSAPCKTVLCSHKRTSIKACEEHKYSNNGKAAGLLKINITYNF